MLLSVLPLAIVEVSIPPHKPTLSVLFVCVVFTSILVAVGVIEASLAVHDTLTPIALVLAAVSVRQLALAIIHTFQPLPLIFVAARENLGFVSSSVVSCLRFWPTFFTVLDWLPLTSCWVEKISPWVVYLITYIYMTTRSLSSFCLLCLGALIKRLELRHRLLHLAFVQVFDLNAWTCTVTLCSYTVEYTCVWL
jgi:hypothetical protein